MIVASTCLILAAGFATLSAQPALEFRTMGPLETRTVTGAPYSATAVTTFTQTLADGTHITRTIQAQLARDSAGRTRREENISAIGPWSTGANEQRIVTISDPVAQARYVLHPDQKVAVKASTPGEGLGALIETKKRQAMEEAGRVKVSTSETFGFASKEGAVMVFSGIDKKAQVEDLGDQVIEGLRAHGRREKRTFAVGEIGNDRPIETVSETWFSDELQTVVLSKRTDPRVGDNEYRLTNVLRAEPSPSLFEVPAGFIMKDEGRRRD
jgi:hypothetical protein